MSAKKHPDIVIEFLNAFRSGFFSDEQSAHKSGNETEHRVAANTVDMNAALNHVAMTTRDDKKFARDTFARIVENKSDMTFMQFARVARVIGVPLGVAGVVTELAAFLRDKKYNDAETAISKLKALIVAAESCISDAEAENKTSNSGHVEWRRVAMKKLLSAHISGGDKQRAAAE